jgi:6-pyruvoyltetrahydropterin/6-carboxytetrahydropterin synthase
MTHAVTVRHNFETGHRLPHLGGKCQNLHGHSWWVTVRVEAPQLAPDGTVVEFGHFKALLREWVDEHLDHGLMLGHADPLLEPLAAAGKVFTFAPYDGLTLDLTWPTVENVAVLLARVASLLLSESVTALSAHVAEVRVSETHVNEASWTA